MKNLRRWTLWRRKAAGPAAVPPAAPPVRRPVPAYWLADALQAVLAWLLPSSAMVVAALGQFALAIVLGFLALGVWLRLWRCRAGRSPG